MDNAFYYNALAQEENGNYGTLKKLYDSCDGDWESAYKKYSENNPVARNPSKEWEKLKSSDIQLVLLNTPDYPPLLKEISHPPLGIYVHGEIPQSDKSPHPSESNASSFSLREATSSAPLQHRSLGCGDKIPIAIVGTRKATSDGKMIARHFASELTKSGFAIISGLAFGIDASAHEGCLDTGGTTVAVLASGADIISPRTNAKLAERILKNGGAIISEYPPGSEAQPYRFLERNRIISGLSKGVLVIETPESSGALATVRFATEQNRDVFVVPGPIAHSNFAGSHYLIRNGAELVTKPEHIMEAYGIIQECAHAENNLESSPEEKLVLDALRANPREIDIDKVIAITKLEPRTVNQTLSFLLIKGVIKENESGYMIKQNKL